MNHAQKRSALPAILCSLLLACSGNVNDQNNPPAFIVLASISSSRAQANADCDQPAVSVDGRYVVFSSTATNLVSLPVPPGFPFRQIFLRDMILGTTVLVSANTTGDYANQSCDNPDVSDDGRYVVFDSTATDLVSGHTGTVIDIFLRDLETGTTSLVSRKAGGASHEGGNNPSTNAVVSSSGEFVSFHSLATDLDTTVSDTNGMSDVFRWSQSSLETTAVSVNSTGTGMGSSASFYPSLSPDGRHIAFVSHATDLISGGTITGSGSQIIRRDMVDGTNLLVSRKFGGTPYDGGTQGANYSSISGDGRHVAFSSSSPGLLGPNLDTNGMSDIFVRDCALQTTKRVSVSSGGVEGNNWSDFPAISNDGNFVVFESRSTNFISDINLLEYDIFRHNLSSGKTELMSTGMNGQGNAESKEAEISGDGASVIFSSIATNLIEGDQSQGDLNNRKDIFRRGP